ncbi:MAG TPA: antibiotic biosynthesis monooxygenase [Gaiellales bacterium]
MSVTMMLRVKADPERVREVINSDPARIEAINARAKELGAIHHRFIASADGTEVVVVDEWESPEAFQQFFAASPDIGQMMQEIGVSSEPEITFWNELPTDDAF